MACYLMANSWNLVCFHRESDTPGLLSRTAPSCDTVDPRIPGQDILWEVFKTMENLLGENSWSQKKLNFS